MPKFKPVPPPLPELMLKPKRNWRDPPFHPMVSVSNKD